MIVCPGLKKARKEERRIDHQTLKKENESAILMAFCILGAIFIIAVAMMTFPQGGVLH